MKAMARTGKQSVEREKGFTVTASEQCAAFERASAWVIGIARMVNEAKAETNQFAAAAARASMTARFFIRSGGTLWRCCMYCGLL